jgi:Ca2+/Na+ antiporter
MMIALLILTLNMMDGDLTRSAAIICILLFISYVIYLYISSKKSEEKHKKELDISQKWRSIKEFIIHVILKI